MDQAAFEALQKTVAANDKNTNIMFIMAGLGITLLGVAAIRQKKIIMALVKNNNALSDLIDQAILHKTAEDMNQED